MKYMAQLLFLLIVSSVHADILLLQDTFNTSNTNKINYDLGNRQSGSLTTKSWIDSKNDNYQTQIDGQTLRLYAQGNASLFVQPDYDFALTTNQIRIAVDMQLLNPSDGFAMINFGMAEADGYGGNLGYSFRLDARGGVYLLKFYDHGVQKASMDVNSYVPGGVGSISLEFLNGNTVSASFNGNAYDFGSGQYAYTGTTETENRIMLGWYGDGDPNLTSAKFDNLTVEAIPEPVSLGLIGFSAAFLLISRRIASF
jgi:hypothetical protein